MKINSIKIENLFDIFYYDIAFKQNENVLIITGPNGYGKTMILNIIFSLFNRQFHFFQKLAFEKITLCLDEDIKIIISKTKYGQIDLFGGIEDKYTINFVFYQYEEELDNLNYSQESESNIESILEKYLPVRRVAVNKWIDIRTESLLTTDKLLLEYIDKLPDDVTKNILRVKSEKVNNILDSIQVHLIREQRLFKKADIKNSERRFHREEKEQTIMVDAIQIYSDELKQLIRDVSQKSFSATQELDSSYPKRLTNEKNIIL